VSPLANRFLFMIGSRMLGFGCRQYGRLFLAIAGLFVFFIFRYYFVWKMLLFGPPFLFFFNILDKFSANCMNGRAFYTQHYVCHLPVCCL